MSSRSFSISEIFEISNKNRKKNKARKKTTAVQVNYQATRNSSSSCKAAPKQKDPPTANYINYHDVTEMIKSQCKHDGKENGMNHFKAVSNMNDNDFIRFLGWPSGNSSVSPTKLGGRSSHGGSLAGKLGNEFGPTSNSFVISSSQNTFQSPLVKSNSYNPKSHFQ